MKQNSDPAPGLLVNPISPPINSTNRRHLVELFGGTIDVQSKRGEGSTFSFEINHEDCRHRPQPPDIDKLCLLSEDDQLAESVALLSARWGKRFVHVRGWDESARAQLRNLTSFDVLLADDPILDPINATVLSLDGSDLSKPFAVGELVCPTT